LLVLASLPISCKTVRDPNATATLIGALEDFFFNLL
jgi:hypothetical protein